MTEFLSVFKTTRAKQTLSCLRTGDNSRQRHWENHFLRFPAAMQMWRSVTKRRSNLLATTKSHTSYIGQIIDKTKTNDCTEPTYTNVTYKYTAFGINRVYDDIYVILNINKPAVKDLFCILRLVAFPSHDKPVPGLCSDCRVFRLHL